MAVGMLSGLYSNYQQGEQIRLARSSGNQYALRRTAELNASRWKNWTASANPFSINMRCA
jgi:hypothetical protein